MTLRPAIPEDAAPLAALARRAMRAKWEHMYRPEDFAAWLSEAHSDEKAAKEIDDPGMRVAVIEDEAGELVAFCKLVLSGTFDPVHSDAKAPLELKQLYTAPDRLGMGLGARLMDWALDQARSHGADEIQLSVWSGNQDAQRFYTRYGFLKIADIIFPVGEQLDEEFLFALRL
ncbi:MAG: GNAT family N-acetyltransferase [Sphingomonadales bacterium]|nr:GNAT family N-acetyltransferase [Sphingomonadales bacterium]MDE2569855.1 GNAT family N-acetyltransferase [Sphingomonadales bacterium]